MKRTAEPGHVLIYHGFDKLTSRRGRDWSAELVPAERRARWPSRQAHLTLPVMEAPELLQRLAARMKTGGAEPVSRLIIDDLWLAVIEGALEVGERLPTARELAIGLGVSPRSIEHAYAGLERRGVIVNRPGAGTFVSLSPASDEDLARHQKFAALCVDTVDRATALGFDIDDLVDALTELRTAERDTPAGEPGP